MFGFDLKKFRKCSPTTLTSFIVAVGSPIGDESPFERKLRLQTIAIATIGSFKLQETEMVMKECQKKKPMSPLDMKKNVYHMTLEEVTELYNAMSDLKTRGSIEVREGSKEESKKEEDGKK